MTEVVFAGASLHPDLHHRMVAFADSLIGCHGRGFGECATLGVFAQDLLIGVVVFHNWQPEAGVIEISAASTTPRWLRRHVLDRIFSWSFIDRGCQMVVARISEENKPLHRIFHAYGFKSIVIPRLRGRDEDERIFTLTDDDWRASKFKR
jgi:RimJ/RimL family protein N-acetyltransferase